MTIEDLDAMFQPTNPDDPDALGGAAIRDSAKAFARVVLANTPPGSAQTKAICIIVETAVTARWARLAGKAA